MESYVNWPFKTPFLSIDENGTLINCRTRTRTRAWVFESKCMSGDMKMGAF